MDLLGQFCCSTGSITISGWPCGLKKKFRISRCSWLCFPDPQHLYISTGLTTRGIRIAGWWTNWTCLFAVGHWPGGRRWDPWGRCVRPPLPARSRDPATSFYTVRDIKGRSHETNMAEVVARLLALTALWVRIQTSLKNTKMGDMSKGVANTL